MSTQDKLNQVHGFVERAVSNELEKAIREISNEEIARAQSEAARRIEDRLKEHVLGIAVRIQRRFSTEVFGECLRITVDMKDLEMKL